MSKDLWSDDQVQFARLLAELSGILPAETVKEAAVSMDLEPHHVEELLDRAVSAWERILEAQKPPKLRYGTFDLEHFSSYSGQPPPDHTWIYLEYGHATGDSRCQGGAWYYKGDKEAALIKLKECKKLQSEAANAYYNQPWV